MIWSIKVRLPEGALKIFWNMQGREVYKTECSLLFVERLDEKEWDWRYDCFYIAIRC